MDGRWRVVFQLILGIADYLTNYNFQLNIISDIKDHKNYNRLPVNNCGESLSDRIVGGSEARLGQFPWMARLGYTVPNCPKLWARPRFKCGGSLITEEYVLSAAHCIVQIPMVECPETGGNESVMLTHVRLGEFVTNKEIDCEDDVCADPPQDFLAIEIIYHASFDNPPNKFDIALVKLDKKAVFTRWVSPICLPLEQGYNTSFVGIESEVAGWGVKDVNTHETSNILLYVGVTMIDISKCINTYAEDATLDVAEICAGGEAGKDSCSGDSGGPLMMVSSQSGTPKYYVMGIVSFGAAICGEAEVPAVYTNVPYYMTWILDKMSFN